MTSPTDPTDLTDDERRAAAHNELVRVITDAGADWDPLTPGSMSEDTAVAVIAVADTVAVAAGAATLVDAARWELELLWSDLDDAKRHAINGTWSIGCDNIVDRITRLTRLVGPTAWGHIPLTLLEDGTYQRIHAALGIDVHVDMVEVAECRRTIEEQAARWVRHGN